MQTNNWNWLKLIAIGRILSSLTFFMYVGSIQQLITICNLSVTGAGLIQTSLVIGFGSITPAFFGFIIDVTNNHLPINSGTN